MPRTLPLSLRCPTWLACLHEPSEPQASPGHRPRRRRGETADAAHGRPGQAGGPVRRDLPPHRLRALQRGQQRLPARRGAHAVQVALPRPSRHHHLADVGPARQLRRPGAGPAARRQALVSRQRRRDLPVSEPDPRRPARHRRRGRRRPRLPHGLLADGRPARRERRTLHGRRDPAADLAGRPVRRDRRQPAEPADDPRVPGEAEGSDRPARTTPTRSWPAWATTSSTPRRCWRR